jgi:hypothetical protein
MTPAIAALALAAGAAVSAQEVEVDEQSPYYEDDAWYDVSEWLDGNDYNPADEDPLRWDDEVYQRPGSDVEPDLRDNPRRNPQIDQGPGSQKDYGYDDKSTDDDWFYDHYDDRYVWYDRSEQKSPSERGGDEQIEGSRATGSAQVGDNQVIYKYAHSFYDEDGDGFYDGLYAYVDSDSDGEYDRQKHYTFGDAQANRMQNKPRRPRQHDPERRDQGQQRDDWDQKKQEKRDWQHEQDEHDQRQRDREREWQKQHGEQMGVKQPAVMSSIGHQLTGTVSQTKSVQVRGKEYQVVVLDPQMSTSKQDQHQRRQEQTQRDNRGAQYQQRQNREQQRSRDDMEKQGAQSPMIVVDLGPKEKLNLNVEKGTQLTVLGPLARIGGKPIIMAQQVKGQDEKMSQIERLGVTLEGRVKNGRMVDCHGQQHMILVMERQRKDYLVDLGPAASFNGTLREGDRISVSGVPIKMKDHRMLMARQLQANDQTHEIPRHETAGNAKQKTESKKSKSEQREKESGY